VTAKSFVRKVPSGRSLLWRAAPPKLARLDIELTERCNNACLHCSVARPAGDLEAKAREWPEERWKALLGEAAALGCLVVRFTGGEPLLRPDFEEIYRHARQLGLRVMLFTNATLLTPRLARLLRDVPPLETVEVSIYGNVRKFPNGNPGFLWTDGRVIFENGAVLNVENGLGYTNDGPGGNSQGMRLFCEKGDRGGIIDHSDDYRGVAHGDFRHFVRIGDGRKAVSIAAAHV
jgi:hypothetical protein